MKDIINDWVPETKSLLESLVAAGFTLLGGDDGEAGFKFREGKLDDFIENLIACDEAQLYVKDPSGKKRTLFLVLGNEPGVIVSDYTLPIGEGTDHIEAVTNAHYDKWCNVPQPTKPNPYIKR